MSDRLKELQRQRALIQEQLAWLDREIAATLGASKRDPGSITTSAPLSGRPNPVPVSGDAAAAERAAEEIIAEYQTEVQRLPGTVRRGCFLYFGIALALLGLSVFVFYLLKTKG